MEVFENLSKLDWRIVWKIFKKNILRFRPFVLQIFIDNDIKCYTCFKKNRTVSLTLKYRKIFFDFFIRISDTSVPNNFSRFNTMNVPSFRSLVSRFINSVARAATSLHNPTLKTELLNIVWNYASCTRTNLER